MLRRWIARVDRAENDRLRARLAAWEAVEIWWTSEGWRESLNAQVPGQYLAVQTLARLTVGNARLIAKYGEYRPMGQTLKVLEFNIEGEVHRVELRGVPDEPR